MVGVAALVTLGGLIGRLTYLHIYTAGNRWLHAISTMEIPDEKVIVASSFCGASPGKLLTSNIHLLPRQDWMKSWLSVQSQSGATLYNQINLGV